MFFVQFDIASIYRLAHQINHAKLGKIFFAGEDADKVAKDPWP